MRTTFTRAIFLSISFMFLSNILYSQNGLENVIIEKYYISNAADSIGSVGVLPVGSVTYRIYVDMQQGYKFQMAYGNSTHPLSITTSTSFFNNEDRGATSPTYTKAQAKNNTVMLDSWLTAGAACVGNFGVLKTDDDGVSNVVNGDGILLNNDPNAGIPLTQQDGFLAGTPGTFGTIGIDNEIAVFDATSQLGGSFTTTNGAWYCLAGAVGADTVANKLLIAQLTTNGKLHLKLNIQLGTPSGGTELYVADNPTGTEFMRPFLSYISDTVYTSIPEKAEAQTISIYPNPSKGIFTLNIVNTQQSNSKNDNYSIYNVLGNKVFSKKISANQNNYFENIDLENLCNGIYFIEITLNGITTSRKLIKN